MKSIIKLILAIILIVFGNYGVDNGRFQHIVVTLLSLILINQWFPFESDEKKK